MATGLRESESDTVVKHLGGEVTATGGGTAGRADGDGHRERDTVVSGVAGLYALTLTGLGIVFPLAFFLSGEQLHKGLYLSVFHIFVYTTALVFLVYLYGTIQWYKCKARRARKGGRSRRKKLSATYKSMSELEENAAIGVVEHRSRGSDQEIFPPHAEPEVLEEVVPEEVDPPLEEEDGVTGPETATDCRSKALPLIYYSGEGVNFFLRMGVIAFGLGSAMLDAFRLLQYSETEDTWKCFGILFILNTSLRLVFTLVQSFFLFKHHKVILNFHKSFMKFGLLHLVAANLVTWALTIVLEASGAFHHIMESQGHRANHHHRNKSAYPPSYDGSNVQTCFRQRTLADEASPYLFPFVIEFSLLSAAIFYKLYSNIGQCVFNWRPADSTPTEGKSRDKLSAGSKCQKANSGLFPGLTVFTMVFVGMCFFLYYDVRPVSGSLPTRGVIHLSSDLAVNTIALMALVPAFCYLKKLRFTGYLDSKLDQNLLVVALAGYYLLLGFMGVAAFAQLAKPEIEYLAPYIGVSAILTFVQSTLQVCFIFDGLRRRARNSEQEEQKPARSFITFLLICNLAMWVINTFELKEAHMAPVFADFYGPLGWTIIMHVCLPLAIYFRFHASVCLSDIWLHSYSQEQVCRMAVYDTKHRRGKQI